MKARFNPKWYVTSILRCWGYSRNTVLYHNKEERHCIFYSSSKETPGTGILKAVLEQILGGAYISFLPSGSTSLLSKPSADLSPLSYVCISCFFYRTPCLTPNSRASFFTSSKHLFHLLVKWPFLFSWASAPLLVYLRSFLFSFFFLSCLFPPPFRTRFSLAISICL